MPRSGTKPTDPWNLERFVAAQAGGVYERVIQELKSGCKHGHWMWFIFPQLKGLGVSGTSRFYGLASLEEALAYLDHPDLGPRLTSAVAAVQSNDQNTSLNIIFGSPDDLKFCSSMTLFEVADPSGPFSGALARWCEGKRDERTMELLGLEPS